MTSFGTILGATLRSFGATATLAGCGWLFERLDFLPAAFTKQLGEISMNLTIPSLLFSTILGCSQNRATVECESLSSVISRSVFMLFLPFIYVTLGVLLGKLAIRLAGVPESYRACAIASVAFGNSTGLPLTLLTVIQQQFAPNTNLGKTDPIVMLSVYLIFYPVLQWSIGSYLFQAATEGAQGREELLTLQDRQHAAATAADAPPALVKEKDEIVEQLLPPPGVSLSDSPSPTIVAYPSTSNEELDVQALPVSESRTRRCWEQAKILLSKGLQPPVIAVLAALVVGLIKPLWGVFVDYTDRDDDAPLQWWFDAIQTIGKAAVPLNMLILGASLSRGLRNFDPAVVIWSTHLCVAFMKLIVLPGFAIGLCYTLDSLWHGLLDESVDQTFYLVMMIVAAMPTANNITVMAEVICDKRTVSVLSMGIFIQFALGVIILPCSVSLFMLVATSL